MTWMDIIISVFGTIVIPYGLMLAQQWANGNAKEKALAQWASGAASFAAKAYIDIGRARQANPGADLRAIVDTLARRAAEDMMQNYKATADQLGATSADGVSRVTGEIGKLLAADPTVSVVAPATRMPANAAP